MSTVLLGFERVPVGAFQGMLFGFVIFVILVL